MKVEKIIQNLNKSVNVAYLSPYIPRECGVATFTKQLYDAVNILNPEKAAKIIAIDDSKGQLTYPKEVEYKIDYDNSKSYISAAKFINRSKIEILSLQHEFGLFGKNSGENILHFINQIKKPFVVTFHTVLSSPDSTKKEIVQKIAAKACAVIVMADEAVARMVNIYNVDQEKILKIPHGVPDIPFVQDDSFKNKLGISGAKIISTFGLLSPNKGIEYVISAMPSVLKKAPNSSFLIIGKTHPNIQSEFGEIYRQSLISLAKKLNIEKNIKFVNRFLTLEEIIYYLLATDIYITPYLEPEQITSGTLAYALGAGKVCISTPYAYAKEVLAQNRGYLVPFRDSRAIANKLIRLLLNEKSRNDLSRKSYFFGRKMIWENIGHKYLTVFQEILEK